MDTSYEMDLLAWARVQVALLRSGQLSLIDIEHIAQEIEAVGKSEQRELASRLSVLLMHLLKWRLQPGRRRANWRRTLDERRKSIARQLARTPSLGGLPGDPDWDEGIWSDALVGAIHADEPALEDLPASCPWTMDHILSRDFYPG
ncbi:MAG TPA: DUF29 domain-containing protein [Janthinobacterium sp.]|nr:DUF29 domain-containing protein [Janthinobacterium sp.]